MTTQKSRGRPKHPDILTPGEWRIVQGVRHGMTSRQIAERRGISIDAVKYHVANILEKLDLPNRKALKQWDGIHKGSLLKPTETHMTDAITLGQIGQISRNVKDIDAARDWYSNTLGITHLFSFGNLAFFDCQGVRLFLNQSEAPLPADSIIYFKVDDIHSAEKSAQGQRREIHQRPSHDP